MNIDTLKMLGKKIPSGTAEIRDAVHVAVISVGVKERVFAGQHVGIKDGLADPGGHPKVGIIDPFLLDSVFPGEVCFLYLYPGSITSLLHHWSHPQFPTETKQHTDAGYEQLRSIIRKLQAERDELEEKFTKAEEGRRLAVASAFVRQEDAEKFLREVAEQHCVDYDDMVNEIRMTGCYVQKGGTSLENEWNDDDKKERIWAAVEAVTGERVQRDSFGPFSCSC